jgi:hypothetical protein
MPYLSRRALKGLAQYKYVASGLTWLDDAHQPAWNGEEGRQGTRQKNGERAATAAARPHDICSAGVPEL